MRTIRILKLTSSVVAIVTAMVAVALVALQGQTDAAIESMSVSTDTRPVIPGTTAIPPVTVAPATTIPATTVPAKSTISPESTAVVVPTTLAPGPKPAAFTLRPGDSGPEVLALQQRLHSLGFWLGSPDGTYGDLTVQAVMAFQKVEGTERDGTAGPTTLAALGKASRPRPASASGDLIEVDKNRQVVFIVRGGIAVWTLNTSTGTEKPYQSGGQIELADTPVGRWSVDWVVDGQDPGALGSLYRPRYFHRDGIAVYGYPQVPAFPASHGCVRVSNAAMDWIWAEDIMAVDSTVWIY